MPVRRWLPRLTVSQLVPLARFLGAAAARVRAVCQVLNPNALYGFVGLGFVFGGLAAFSWPAAFLLTGLLIFRDATRTPPPAPPAPRP